MVQRDPQQILMVLFALVIAIPIHEFAHALSAVNNGDDGPRREGRLSIFPWDHFDPLGAICCVLSTVSGFGLGWGRPVLVNPGVLNNPKWSMCKIAAWGPFSNFLLALGFAIILRFVPLGAENAALEHLLCFCIQVNLGLMLFNLIPIGPLDGAKVLVAFLPDSQAYEFTRFMDRFGMILLLVLITFGRSLLGMILGPPLVQLMVALIPGETLLRFWQWQGF